MIYAREDGDFVERLACRLEDECQMNIGLDRWVLVPGKGWQRGMSRSLQKAATCAVCVGPGIPDGWFHEEIEVALDLQTRKPDFRVIPVLLPGADPASLCLFLTQRTWADFREDQDQGYAFHVLQQGIRGLPVGRWPLVGDAPADGKLRQYENKIIELRRFRELGVHEEVIIEYERKILDHWFNNGGNE